eukprot:TRINITY_DN1267_c0_g1_i1.p1 TRINITY_DN1267_c0_g1~~TRINITY_DN1267_c0_g1_i1.p1  ORF type:complete len:388 (-),score=90.51 TRINITY_DN1267_c0_g1_i1:99-1262(-)
MSGQGDGAAVVPPVPESPACVLPGHLYLGDELHACSKRLMRSCGINRVLSVGEHAFHVSGTYTLHIPLSDHGRSTLSKYLLDCFRFIDNDDNCCPSIAQNGKVGSGEFRATGGSGCPFETSKDSRGGNSESGTAALVHCAYGVNRSASVVLSYLVVRKGWRLVDAATHLKTVRPIVRPCTAYLEQLFELEKFKFGVNSCKFEELTALMSRRPQQTAAQQRQKRMSAPPDMASLCAIVQSTVAAQNPHALASAGFATALVSAGLLGSQDTVQHAALRANESLSLLQHQRPETPPECRRDRSGSVTSPRSPRFPTAPPVAPASARAKLLRSRTPPGVPALPAAALPPAPPRYERPPTRCRCLSDASGSRAPMLPLLLVGHQKRAKGAAL